ncbi:MAG: hypothetical protein B7O98_05390 [Zestosphaera tikiterensis]|uniref:Uncharacterized protein n=1 Tax=Zestosphaera tikiterensis TaxID=1973259 RepID=A0A2R7Y5R7_9CREN|nr:MAG: hypothetical protein B7O98_05390 [Zestosphaera tikiterensis]
MTSVENEGGVLKWFRNLIGPFSRSKSKLEKKRVISLLIVHIDTAKQEVTEAIARLKSRFENLLKATIAATVSKEGDRALIYANEAHQVREMVTKLVIVEKVLEQVKLRLETLEDVSNISPSLIEVSNLLSLAKDYVKDVIPSLAYNIETMINESRKMLASTTDYVQLKPEQALEYTPEAKKLLEEIEKAAAETVKNQLPEIPLNILVPVKVKSNLEERVKEAVAQPQPSKPKTPSRRMEPSMLDKAVLEYILTHNGFLDVNDVASKLGVGKEEIYESLNRLKEQNKVIF